MVVDSLNTDSTKLRLAMFPGQGSQFVGMGKEWCEQFKEANEAFEEASDFSRLDLKKICFDSTDEELRLTEFTQPAILTASIAVYRAIRANHDLDVNCFMGHSLGEYSALVAAEVLPLGAAALLVHLRGKYMQEAVPVGEGGMSAILFRDNPDSWEAVAKLCVEVNKSTNGTVYPANQNTFDQVVVAGSTSALENFESEAPKKLGCRRVMRLPVSAPFHCPLMQSAADRLDDDLAKIDFHISADNHYLANVDAKLYGLKDIGGVRERLKSQITAPVLWRSSLETVLDKGYTDAMEFGPGAVLTGMAKKFRKDEKGLNADSFSKIEDLKKLTETN